MTWPGIEPWSPGPLVNTLLIRPINVAQLAEAKVYTNCIELLDHLTVCKQMTDV